VNDNQTRKEILFEYYNAMRNNRSPEKLTHIDSKDYNFNFGYLVEHDLLNGVVHYSDDGVAHYTPNGGITGKGMDIVESFIDKCAKNADRTDPIDNSDSYIKKINLLLTIWANNPILNQQSWDILSSLIR